MWIQKLAGGVLRVITPLGPRYLKPSFAQRLYLLWIFRHFTVLSSIVLSKRQCRLMESICSEHKFVATLGLEDFAVLGTLEQRPPVSADYLPPRRPNAKVSDMPSAFAAKLQQGS